MLIGRISFRMNLPRNKKKKQAVGKEVEEEQAQSNGTRKRKQCCVDNNNVSNGDNLSKECDVSTDAAPLVGFIFHLEQQQQPQREPLSLSACYLLSVPRNLLPLTSESVRTHALIYIDCYNLFDFDPQISSKFDLKGMIEIVGPTGMSRAVTSRDEQQPSTAPKLSPFPASALGRHNDKLSDVCTLPQLQRREWIDQVVPDTSNIHSKRKRSGSSRCYSLCAQVNAVSPIIAIDPDDPCCLVELHDAPSSCSCVVVLTKCALPFQPAMVPGDWLTLYHVKRQEWRLPENLLPAERVPQRVFVVDRVDQLDINTKTVKAGVSIGQKLPLFIPPKPLTNLTGVIVSVRIKAIGATQQIHDVELAGEQGKRVTLLLTYFPMSTSLQLSLRAGASIKAFNLHCISSRCYAACLRSTIVLDQIDSLLNEQSYGESVSLEYEATLSHTSQKLCQLISRLEPCSHFRIRRSYLEDWYQQRLSAWLAKMILPPSIREAGPSVEDLMKLCFHRAQTSPRQTKLSRNAYLEFLDHGLECSEVDNTHWGCHLSHHERQEHAPSRSFPACLSDIHDACTKLLMTSLESNWGLLVTQLQVGWTGSVVRSASDICRAGNIEKLCHEQSLDGNLYTGGLIYRTKKKHEWSQAVLSNGHVALPLRFTNKSVSNQQFNQQVAFALVELQLVVISFLCTGASICADSSIHAMPPYDRRETGGESYGNCFIVEMGGYRFVASIYLECDEADVVTGGHKANEVGEAFAQYRDNDTLDTVQSCLDPTECGEGTMFMGLLSRKTFWPSKKATDSYGGLVLYLSHISAAAILGNPPSINDVACLQTIDLKISVPTLVAKRKFLQQLMGTLGLTNITDDELMLICAWWNTSSQVCSLLGGGWNEYTDGSSAAGKRMTLVRVPKSAIEHDLKRGYTRFRCDIDDLSALTVFCRPATQNVDKSFSAVSIDFIGGHRLFPGMLDRRPRRRTLSSNRIGKVVWGELLCSPDTCNSGVPQRSLAELHWDICSDLRTRSRFNLAPSVVREIRGAIFLSLTFCRALAECTKCFQALVPKTARKGQPAVQQGRKESTTRVDLSSEIKSYWHLPLPLVNDAESTKTNDAPKSEQPASVKTTNLCCPRKHDLRHATVKWECSGIIDDGTGQAKLFAERDAAVMLLGLSPDVLERIEAGAYCEPNGIVFSKGLPPKPEMASAIVQAQSLARSQHAQACRYGLQRPPPLTEKDVLDRMPPTICAHYLLQRHCRLSKEPKRELVLFVRTKPLSDDVVYLNQTEIEASVPGGSGNSTLMDRSYNCTRYLATYSLPPLKLQLVDAAVESDGLR